MKEKIYTIPLIDAFKAGDECPFCFVERQLEQHTMDFVLGSGASYMEDDVRAETDLETFFDMYRKNPEFRELFKNSKGFCIPHFGDLVEAAETALSDKTKREFLDILLPMMEENMQRLCDDLDWFCDKFDYRNKDADWRTSKDALPRGMQKAAGGYPADEPYTMDK